MGLSRQALVKILLVFITSEISAMRVSGEYRHGPIIAFRVHWEPQAIHCTTATVALARAQTIINIVAI